MAHETNNETNSQNQSGYHVPVYIVEGDFRKPKGVGDVDRFYAHDIVRLANVDPADTYVVDAVYGELAKAREAFREIDGYLKAGVVEADAYADAGKLFEERIDRIIHGESDLNDPKG